VNNEPVTEWLRTNERAKKQQVIVAAKAARISAEEAEIKRIAERIAVEKDEVKCKAAEKRVAEEAAAEAASQQQCSECSSNCKGSCLRCITESPRCHWAGSYSHKVSQTSTRKRQHSLKKSVENIFARQSSELCYYTLLAS